jgi:hypothetical protein
MHDARLHMPLLRHPSVCEDVQTVIKLQQTSKQLQTAVATVLQGQLPVVLSTVQPQRLLSFEQWLAKHAGLLKGLYLKLDPSSSAVPFGNLNGRLASCDNGFLGAAAQRAVRSLLAAAASRVTLQSLALFKTTASLDLLHHLPAAHLTRLCIQVDWNCGDSVQAVAALTRLQKMFIGGPTDHTRRSCAAAADDALVPLAAGLQQLTMLAISPATPAQLLQLPPKLQQLHIICRHYRPEEVQQLAAWVQQNGRIISSLHLEDCPRPDERVEVEDEWAAALSAVIAAFTATAAAAAAAAAAAVVPETTSAGWQLQSLSVAGLTSDCPSAALLQALPASSLTSLQCTVGWGDGADIAALCSLTCLQNLDLQERDNTYNWDELIHSISGHADGVLAQLSVLQHLTCLQLSSARTVQLQQMRLPQLRRLVAVVDTTQSQEQLLLGHMSSLTALTLYDNRYPCDSFALTEQLPPNLRRLDMKIWVERSSGEPGLASFPCRFRPAGGRALTNFDLLPTRGPLWLDKCIYAGDLVETPPVSGPKFRSADRRPCRNFRNLGPSAQEFRPVDELASPEVSAPTVSACSRCWR